MQIVESVLISDDLFTRHFCCDLSHCKGACCIEGDMGAPLEQSEVLDLEENYPIFKKYMLPEGIAKIEDEGTFEVDPFGDLVTPLISNALCAYAFYDENGVVKCAIEKAFLNKEIEYYKPISCHLFPIRITKLPDYLAINYFHWEVCSAAFKKGDDLQLPVYKFLKEPLIRKFGEEWYNSLEELASTMNK